MFDSDQSNSIDVMEMVMGLIRVFRSFHSYENHSHNNSFGVTETRHQRAVGMSNQVASNETISIEILKHWSGVLSKIEISAARKLLYLKYNTEYESNVFFRVSRFLFGKLTPWKISPV
jgi:hypothetical protein